MQRDLVEALKRGDAAAMAYIRGKVAFLIVQPERSEAREKVEQSIKQAAGSGVRHAAALWAMDLRKTREGSKELAALCRLFGDDVGTPQSKDLREAISRQGVYHIELTWLSWSAFASRVGYFTASTHLLPPPHTTMLATVAGLFGWVMTMGPAHKPWNEYIEKVARYSASQTRLTPAMVGLRVLLRSWLLATCVGGTTATLGVGFFIGIPAAMAISFPVLLVGAVVSPIAASRIAQRLQARGLAQLQPPVTATTGQPAPWLRQPNPPA